MMVSRNRLRHQLSVTAPGPLVPDGGGGYTEDPIILADHIFGEILPATVRDLERSMPNVVVASASHIVTIDHIPGVTLTSTLVFHDDGKDRTFTIAGVVDPDERHIELVLACEEAL